MTLNIEKEYDLELGLEYEAVAREVIGQVLEEEGCPYEAEVSLLLVSDEEIHKINLEYRGIDRPTDVLSFPQLTFDTPGDFSFAETHEADSFNPDSGELFWGILSCLWTRWPNRLTDITIKGRENTLFLSRIVCYTCWGMTI